MGPGPTIDDLLAEARADFAARLPGKVDELLRLSSIGEWEGVRVGSHKLRGSAATYGFAALGALATTVEELLLGSACRPDVAARDRVCGLLKEARAEALRAASAGSGRR
jgi:hypothetical protein